MQAFAATRWGSGAPLLLETRKSPLKTRPVPARSAGTPCCRARGRAGLAAGVCRSAGVALLLSWGVHIWGARGTHTRARGRSTRRRLRPRGWRPCARQGTGRGACTASFIGATARGEHAAAGRWLRRGRPCDTTCWPAPISSAGRGRAHPQRATTRADATAARAYVLGKARMAPTLLVAATQTHTRTCRATVA